MKVFDTYAKYYDLVYKDKDYLSEADYIDALISKHAPGSKTVLDLGCGTGRHDFILAEKGYKVTGIEKSKSMFEIANGNVSGKNGKLSFLNGDIRSFELDRKFDVIISLFHVMSYQTTNKDLSSAFLNALNHLEKDGIFIFDFWYGPAVLWEKPEVRIKKYSCEDYTVERKAVPEIRINENIVDVNFDITVDNKADGRREKIFEKHSMRYFFLPEIEMMLNDAGLKIRYCSEWMTGKELNEKSWSGIIVSEAI